VRFKFHASAVSSIGPGQHNQVGRAIETLVKLFLETRTSSYEALACMRKEAFLKTKGGAAMRFAIAAVRKSSSIT